MSRAKDLTNQQFGLLKVLYRIENTSTGHAQWVCQCQCGNKTTVTTGNLKSGHTQSCGCLKAGNLIKAWQGKNKNRYEFYQDYIVGYTNDNTPFIINLDSYKIVKQYCWHANREGYISTISGGEHILMHRLLLPCPPNRVIDHINGEKADNRIENLRIATYSQNNMNKTLQKNNTSNVTGVIFNKNQQQWRAGIGIDGRWIHLGYFTNKEDAIRVRLQAEKFYFKEFQYKKGEKNGTI